MRVLVLGGAGFIGRHAVAGLQRAGHVPIVGSRHPRKAASRLASPPASIEIRRTAFERLPTPESWQGLLGDIDAVINCVGILRERGAETYQAVHVDAPRALAEACRVRRLRLVHVSALGLAHPHRSRFLRSKRCFEDLLAGSGADYCLVRPSLLDGEGGFGARWLRRVSRWPVHALPRGATGRIAALDVGELGEALARLVTWPFALDVTARDREFELGGTQARTVAQYLQALRAARRLDPAKTLALPDSLVRLASHVCDLLHFSPLSFGHWELLQKDNVPAPNRLAELLGRQPRPVGASPAPAATPRPPLLPLHEAGRSR